MDEFFHKQFTFAKHLYNQARHIIREQYKENKTFINSTNLNKKLREQEKEEYQNYRKICKAQVAQSIVRNLEANYHSYFKSLEDYNKNKSKYKSEPKPPKYMDKLNALYFNYQSIKIKGQFIVIDKEHKIHIPDGVYKEELKGFKTINFYPRGRKIKVVISYETPELNEDLNQDDFLSIDLGMNNLCACVSKHDCFIINGRAIKSINQYYNKVVSYLKSRRPLKGKYQDKVYNRGKIAAVTLTRELKILDLYHKASRTIVNFCVDHKIGKLVVGRNKGWKDSINLGKKTNQNFVSIPFYKFLKMLEYKCKMVGIQLVTQEESYTSKCDSLAFEEIGKHEFYKGIRTKRGLFISSTGKAVNADLNGSLNILRKFLQNTQVADEFHVIREIIDRGLILRPHRISLS